jgi:lipopolysaccharide assembly outer membrane protein LptD (OstA)
MSCYARAALFVCCGLTALPAAAQQIPNWECKQFTLEQIDADRVRLMREVECSGSGPNEGQQIFADDLVWNMTTGDFEAIGNVLLVTPTSRLAAEKVVFNTKTGLGSFYTASGSASLGERGAQDRSMFGTLEPDILFYGELIEKIGDTKYRISNGSFTTCVQPTPRWDVITGSATIQLEDYAMLRNAVIRVKDVPVFYLPVMYYPIQSDDRATGFLLPTYGSSSVRGSSLSNAFFWAINRSQDLTLMHDWYTSTGQGYGGEYRYMLAPGAEGYFRAYRLDQNASTVESGGSVSTLPEETSYEARGALSQTLPGGFRALANVDYFTSLASQQLYNTDIYYSSRSQRTISGSVSGSWGGVSLTGQYQRAEFFRSQTQSTVNGFEPVVRANLSSKRLGNLPLYLAAASEAAKYVYITRDGTREDDFSVFRFDVQPTLRAALTNWPFLNLNASLGFRETYYSESRDELGIQVPVGVSRRYFDMRADVIGPSFSRVFNPNNAIADRLKHVIEPTFSVQRVTDYENQERIPTVGGAYDYVVGGSTRIQYGLANRVLVRKAPAGGTASPAASAPRELLTVTVNQSYYTDASARRFDNSYQSNNAIIGDETHFSPISVGVRSSPTALTTASMRMELDQQDFRLRTISASGSSNYRMAQVNIGWTRTSYETALAQSALNAATTINLKQGRTGGTYALDWDITRGYLIQQRWIGFYSAQCCGVTFEYQQFKFAQTVAGVPQDRRFNIGFTLAGIGTFSNFFGALGGGRF